MDEKTKILICVGAATAANCVLCFDHYFGKAKNTSIPLNDIQDAVELASKVKNGAHMVLINHVRGSMGAGREPDDVPCSSRSGGPCCG
jgi:alkylhydroperoxidase/carboxymuconolactone decarboxylase family protein YurZ